jgi:anti-sigma-K factor RskA
MNHEPWLEQAELYALGSLEGDERRDFEKHLPRCGRCQARVSETEVLLSSLPTSLSPVTPPPALKARILDELSGETAPSGHGMPLVWKSLAGTAVLAVALLVLMNLPVSKTSIKPPTMVHDTEMIRALTAPETRPVELKGLETDPGASATFVWNPRLCMGCFVVKNLAPVGPNRVFQLWAIGKDGRPVSVGTFTTDENGNAHVDFPALAEVKAYEKFAVTAEPAGGMPQPTGPMHLLGNF